MNLLVTGGAGFVGAHFVRAAAEAGHRVVVVDDFSGGATEAPPEAAECVRGDVGDVELVRSAIRRHAVDAAVHFAGKIQVAESIQAPELYYDVNLVRSLALLEALRAERIGRLVFSSSAAVYGAPAASPIAESAPLAPINPYGATKLAFEHAVSAYGRAHGLAWAALRYFNAAGAHPSGALGEHHRPETHLIPLAIDAALGAADAISIFGDDHPTDDGTCVRDYVHVCDLADAHLLALEALGAEGHAGAGFALNVGTGRGHSVREVLRAVGRAVGREVPCRVGARREGDPPSLVADVGAAERRLGFRARRVDLAEIVGDAGRAREPRR